LTGCDRISIAALSLFIFVQTNFHSGAAGSEHSSSMTDYLFEEARLPGL